MFEITGNDIAALNDEDLRSLVGRLCEAELRLHGLSTAAVIWGGNQNASDGGIDVRVRINEGAPPGGFVPRASVGFQVKKTDFTPGMIGPEMRPSNQLRPSIRGLIDDHGAYIIASSGSDTSDSALSTRLEAMRSAVNDQPDWTNLGLDFYDRNRLATWTRSHLGLVVWVREKIGRSIPGWKAYGSWVVSPEGVQDEYLFDEKASVHIGLNDETGISVLQGINRIRAILREHRGIVRLVGLSGVGKTRLVQALFDERVGDNALDPGTAVYTDMNDNPTPQPTGMISDLIASRERAIVIVDNCAPDLHRRLAEVCRDSESKISAISVEYDVQDDEPEGTEVVRLDSSSLELVCRLVKRRFPEMTEPDANRIADFSGGNSRIALALAQTSKHLGSVAGLQDEELFRRLFHQRQVYDDGLLKAAQACSLLYSFQGEAFNGDDAELPKIGCLIGMDGPSLFGKVSQLKERDLVQRRSVWRAILPHAIANRLAKMALRQIPLEIINDAFDTERMLKSFTRRLGYLHDSEEARSIAAKWLGEKGELGRIDRLTDLGLTMFENIAAILQEKSVEAIERALRGSEPTDQLNTGNRNRLCSILISIAYESDLFNRCVAGIIQIAITDKLEQTHLIWRELEGLFHLFLSGTHATVEQRIEVVDQLLRSDAPERRSIGLQLLEALLKADNFSATRMFGFGGRARDYGFWPKTRGEKAHWFATTLQLARQFTSENPNTAAVTRSLVAQSLRSTWFLGPDVQEQFEAIATQIASNDYWHEGWIAIRTALAYAPAGVDAAAIERLRSLERYLHPKNLVQRVRAVVLLRKSMGYPEIDEEVETESKPSMITFEKALAAAEKLGKDANGDRAAFAILLPDLVKGDGGRLFYFGKGLALAGSNHRIVWDQFTKALSSTEESERNVEVLMGFLSGLFTIDQQLCEVLLDASLTDETLSYFFPVLQSTVIISGAGVKRLKRAIALGRAPSGAFRFLGWRSNLDATSDNDLSEIVVSLANRDNGFFVAVDILSMRFGMDDQQRKPHSSALICTGRELLANADFRFGGHSYDHHLHTISEACLRGPDGALTAKSLCKRIKNSIAEHIFRAYNFEQLLPTIFELQPLIALDSFFEEAPQIRVSDLEICTSEGFPNRRKQLLDGIPVEELVQWCVRKPDERVGLVCHLVSFDVSTAKRPEWTPIALELFKRAPDATTVLEIFVSRFSPTSWLGSQAAIVESRLELLDQLSDLERVFPENHLVQCRKQLIESVARTREFEDKRDKESDERFE